MWFHSFAFKLLLSGLFIYPGCFIAKAQTCPTNIDFETGNFNGWTCYTGTTSAVGGLNVISISPSGGPSYNRHTMYSANPGVR